MDIQYLQQVSTARVSTWMEGGGGLGHYMHGMCKHELALSTLLCIKSVRLKTVRGEGEGLSPQCPIGVYTMSVLPHTSVLAGWWDFGSALPSQLSLRSYWSSDTLSFPTSLRGEHLTEASDNALELCVSVMQ